MITFKSTGLSKKEQSEIASLICEITDIYGDFYLTKNNLRLFIKENLQTLFECLKKGDKIAYGEMGVAIITGFSDKMPRKYVKILTNKPEDATKLLQALHWEIKGDLYTKIKKNNPLKEVYEKNGFEFLGGRGKEILLIRKENKYVNRDKR
jgi:hypothetical protein